MTIKDSSSIPSLPKEDHRIDQIMNKLVSEPRAFFKHQSRDEPELSPEEKKALASRFLDEKPHLFLLRYGHFLRGHLSYFEESSDPLIQDVLRELSSMSGQKRVKNRRWTAWRRMVDSEDPFVSREGMRTRYPALFEHYFGPGSVQREVAARKPGSDCTLSGMILEHASLQAERDLLKSQAEEEEDIEEFDTSDEEESDGEEEGLRDPFEEFRAAVCQKFLLGKEERFDYSTVDLDEGLDDLRIRERDEEEKYFDEDD
eukprot:TRINITY_DN7990_c0_g1_i1.p1 TRINITY_DN7990_c0_g1~~TRINITY_DN7990_c0_g1_i1.p1  ORF type:complete len:258 (-),score=74.22 TRINITY_DN7990_c0_g1_i1:15-788(-)